ncbi:N-acetylmuramic acid 6-phosphate etherase [Salinimonas sp. HHU 13199]|uniref:N-acetylmuramic acid 6-phosphate etherase n=1 Tax=Salinimonas profundi TaxID=2729140 RepID=A0ABR8LRH9_9ALTE|nr:N-acetylmuramic acid 6-phosphate etherase [Salinimonas profundi]MBD3586745.1 N-acetylmuramic acid 6-phosphate etherase [Salinimonas profundi]
MAGSQETLLAQLDTLISEGRNPATLHIDEGTALDIVRMINREDHLVAPAIEKILPDIAKAVDCIVDGLSRKGRLFYIGAGTSGRLGILDAVECRPTFSVEDTLVNGIIAGGERAITHAVEGAEDDDMQGQKDLDGHAITRHDVIVGLSASGRTPYVCGALRKARERGCITIGIACTPKSPVLTFSDIALCPVVGPEALTGSTRMKSGTAQKLILNMLSTASMIRLGKTYQNLMVDVNASNEKLRARAIRIVMQATGCEAPTAKQALSDAGQNTKVAILIILCDVDAATARRMLENSDGFLRRAVQEQS